MKTQEKMKLFAPFRLEWGILYCDSINVVRSKQTPSCKFIKNMIIYIIGNNIGIAASRDRWGSLKRGIL